jgi:acetyl esterase/lipase
MQNAKSTYTMSRWRWVASIAGVTLAALVYVWPARRNFYGHLDGIDVRLDLSYLAESRDPKQQLDLYLPRLRSGVPVVLFVHGGYWSPLDRRWLQPLLGTHGNIGAALARHGVAAAIVGYRQYPAITRGDDSIDDIARAVRFVRENAAAWDADPQRVYLMGHSAGGHLVSLMALDPSILPRNGLPADAIAGFISVDGIFDLPASLPYLDLKEAKILSDLFGTEPAALLAHSPIAFASAQHSPLLFIDSTGDEPVCLDGFRKMRSRFADAGSKARFVELDGLGHNETIVRVGMTSDPITPLVTEFLGAVAR